MFERAPAVHRHEKENIDMKNLNLPARFSRRARKGATALEYALVLAFVAVAVLGALQVLGTGITSAMTATNAKIATANQ